MDLGDVMQEISDRLDTIAGLRCYAGPPGSVVPPAAIVWYPDSITFDEAYQRGSDSMELPVWVLLARPTDRSTRDLLAAYCNGFGASSVKHVLESGSYQAFDTIRVAGIDFGATTVGGTEYATAIFNLDIAGKGSV